MRTVLFMHFPGARDAQLYSRKYQDLAVEYCREHEDSLVMILEGNGADDKKSQDAILELAGGGFIDQILFPNLATIAPMFTAVEGLLEKLSDYGMKLRFLDRTERLPEMQETEPLYQEALPTRST